MGIPQVGTRLRVEHEAVQKIQRVMIESYNSSNLLILSPLISLQHSLTEIKMAATRSVSSQDTSIAWIDPLMRDSLP
jgi:hypothetical protein